MPDKAVSLLDTACARVAISQHAVPAEVEDCRRRISGLETEQQIIERERCIMADTVERNNAVQAALETERQGLKQLEERWTAEQELVGKILDETRTSARINGQCRMGGPEKGNGEHEVKPLTGRRKAGNCSSWEGSISYFRPG